jgi:hypothetical protein
MDVVSPKQVTFNSNYEMNSPKSTKNHLLATLSSVLLVVVSLAVTATILADDDILNFYTERARHAIESRDPLGAGTVFSLKTKSYYKHIGRGGAVAKTDSAEIEYFYSWGHLDSQKTVTGDAKRFEDIDLSCPNVFDPVYIHSLFPNDTGGQLLAIGFDTDTVADPRPIGLALIDRYEYYPHLIYLSYPAIKNHYRYSRSIRFTEREGLFFPDSVWVVGSKQGVFSDEHYRIETSISEISIQR